MIGVGRRATLSLLAGALSLLDPTPARAFCRTNACDPTRGDTCTVDSDGCRQGGLSLFWAATPVSFAVQANGSPKNHITAASFETVIENAFHTWSSANCSSGKHPNIVAISEGTVPTDLVEYLPGQSNTNVFLFRDDVWMASIPGSALALTTVSYDWHTGEIYDADVEVNGTGGNITNGKPTDGADLPSIITHEVGLLEMEDGRKSTEDLRWAEGVVASMRTKIAQYRRDNLPASVPIKKAAPLTARLLAMPRAALEALFGTLVAAVGPEAQFAHRNLDALSDNDLRRMIQTIETHTKQG